MKKKIVRLLAACLATFALMISPFLNALTPNQINIINALFSVTKPTPEQIAILAAILTDPDHALDAISGDQFTPLVEITEFANRRFLRALYVPLSYDAEDLLTICPRDVNFESWFQIGGGRSFLGGDHHAAGLKMRTYDVTAGTQYYFNKNITGGIAVNYEFDHLHFFTPGDGTLNTVQAAAYGMANYPCFYVMGDLIAGWTNSSMLRSIIFDGISQTSESSFNITDWIFYIEAGPNMHSGVFLVRPFVGYEAGIYVSPAVSETGTGSFNLSFPGSTPTTSESRAGVHLITKNPQCLLWSIDAVWRHRFTTVANKIDITLDAFPDSPFRIEGVKQHRDGFEGTVSVARQFCEYFTFFVEFSGEKWSRYSTWELSTGLLAQW